MTNTSDGRLHVLVSNPFQVLSYTPSFEDYEVLQLADHMHFSSPFNSYANIYANSENSDIMGTQTDDSFALYRTGGASSSTVRRYLPPAAIISALDDGSYVLFIASLNMVIKIDPIRKLVQPFAIPDLTRQNSGPLFAVFGKRVFANVRQATQATNFSGYNQRQVFMLDSLANKGVLGRSITYRLVSWANYVASIFEKVRRWFCRDEFCQATKHRNLCPNWRFWDWNHSIHRNQLVADYREISKECLIELVMNVCIFLK